MMEILSSDSNVCNHVTTSTNGSFIIVNVNVQACTHYGKYHEELLWRLRSKALKMNPEEGLH